MPQKQKIHQIILKKERKIAMNVYDTANKLATEIKQSEEYINYKAAKQALNLNTKLKSEMSEFEKIRYEVQMEMMQTGKNDEEKYKKMQELYAKLIENQEAKSFFEAETKFNVIITDVNKIIGEAIRDVI